MRKFAPIAVFGIAVLVGCTDPGSKSSGSTEATAPANQPASKPASQPSTAASAPADASANPVSGLVKLGEGIDASVVKASDVLFIMARESQGGGKAGRLVAVQRHGQLSFPKRYELSGKDAMVPGVPFKGPFVVYARLDRDGDPMTKGEDDLYGAVTGDVLAGADGAHIVLKKKSDAPPPKAAAH